MTALDLKQIPISSPLGRIKEIEQNKKNVRAHFDADVKKADEEILAIKREIAKRGQAL